MKRKNLYKIFVVDDDPFYNKMLNNYLQEISKTIDYIDNIEIFSFITAQECIDRLNEKPDIVLLDCYLDQEGSPLTGMYVLKNIKEECGEDCKVIMISQQSEILATVELFKLGAYDYIVKDKNSLTRIWLAIENIIKMEFAG